MTPASLFSAETAALFFPSWKQALAASSLLPEQQAAYTREILAFLQHCAVRQTPVTVFAAGQFMASTPTLAPEFSREVLGWFFSQGRNAAPPVASYDSRWAGSSGAKVSRSGNGGPAKAQNIERPEPGADLGRAPWERALITAIREKGFIWRTERTYRDWAARFVRFVAPHPIETAGETEVGAFLSALAVQHRSSRSTQKQALNAVLFFLREALKQPLKEIAFQRAAPCRQMPTVLTRQEIERLRRQLDDTTRLMVELTYGVGLRLTELLRLRVHDVDLRHLRLVASTGNGNKRRTIDFPVRLGGALETHLDRLRRLHDLDRAAGLPGVWVTPEQARECRGAGESFAWQWLFPTRELVSDPETGERRRHHVTESMFQRAVKQAAARASITKRVTPHLLRRSFGPGGTEKGPEIRTLPDPRGPDSQAITSIDADDMVQPAVGMHSPRNAA